MSEVCIQISARSLACGLSEKCIQISDWLISNEITESESLLFGRNFGVATDIQTGPNGNLFVVSLSHGAIYEIHLTRPGARPR